MSNSNPHDRVKNKGFIPFAIVAISMAASCAGFWFAFGRPFNGTFHEDLTLSPENTDSTPLASTPVAADSAGIESYDRCAEQGRLDRKDDGARARETTRGGKTLPRGNQGIAVTGNGPREPSSAAVEIIRFSGPITPFLVPIVDDSSSTPIPGATITAGISGRPVVHARSDLTGVAVLDLPAVFKASIAVIAPGYEPHFENYIFQGQSARERAIRLRKPPGDPGRWIEFYDVQRGTPIPGIAVQFKHFVMLEHEALDRVFAETDQSGRVCLGSTMPAGLNEVRAAGPGHFTAVFDMPGGDAPIPVRVPMLAKSPLLVTVTGMSGKPLPEARVCVSRSSDLSDFSAQSDTDSSGTARFDSIEIDPFGGICICADHPDFAWEKRHFTLQEFVSLGGNPVFVLSPGESAAGSIMTGAGPAAGMLVEASSSNDFAAGSPTGWYTPIRSAVADGSGRFHLKGLSRGAYRLRVRAGADVVAEENVVFPSGPIIIAPDPAIIAICAFMGDGKPAAGTRVFVRRHSGVFPDVEISGLTGPDGVFRMRGAAPGSYDGSVTFPDGFEKGFDFSLEPGAHEAKIRVAR